MLGGKVQMGNTIQWLKDPALVRRCQEALGVRQISIEVPPGSAAKEPNISQSSAEDSSDDKSSKPGNPPFSSSEFSSDSSPPQSSDEEEGSIAWLVAKTTRIGRRRRAVRTPPPHNWDGTPQDPPTKSPSKVTKPQVMVVETIPFLDIYFRLATELGYEPFYITFLPYMFWNVDIVIARWLIVTWCLSFYVGQGSKQLFKMKRPASPPAIRLEIDQTLEEEYGFPSTHATVGTNIPFCIFYGLVGRYQISTWLCLAMAIVWCVSVCLSRIYLGVHSVLDIVAGSLIAVVMFPVLVVFGMKWVDYHIFHTPYMPIFIILTVIFLFYIYPIDSKHWTRDRGDTAATVGAAMGVLVAQCMVGPFPDDLATTPMPMSLPSINSIGLSFTRFVVGLLLLLPTRFIMKLLCYKLLPAIMPTHGVKEEGKRPLVELPYKLITYGALGFNALYLCNLVFEICGISRFENFSLM